MIGTALELKIDEMGDGRPVLMLHGGGGPLTVQGLAEHLSADSHVLKLLAGEPYAFCRLRRNLRELPPTVSETRTFNKRRPWSAMGRERSP